MTKKNLLSTWILLVFFTALIVFFSSFFADKIYLKFIVIFVSVLKFLAISFYFMEMKKAHTFWKASIIIFLVLFSVIVFIIS